MFLTCFPIHRLIPFTDISPMAIKLVLQLFNFLCKDDVQIGLPLSSSRLHNLLVLLVFKRKRHLQAKPGTIPWLLGKHCCTKNTKKMAPLWIRMQGQSQWVKPHLHLTQHPTVSKNGDEGRLIHAALKNCLTIAPEKLGLILQLTLLWEAGRSNL